MDVLEELVKFFQLRPLNLLGVDDLLVESCHYLVVTDVWVLAIEVNLVEDYFDNLNKLIWRKFVVIIIWRHRKVRVNQIWQPDCFHLRWDDRSTPLYSTFLPLWRTGFRLRKVLDTYFRIWGLAGALLWFKGRGLDYSIIWLHWGGFSSWVVLLLFVVLAFRIFLIVMSNHPSALLHGLRSPSIFFLVFFYDMLCPFVQLDDEFLYVITISFILQD